MFAVAGVPAVIGGDLGVPAVDIFNITPACGCAEILITLVLGTATWGQQSLEGKSLVRNDFLYFGQIT